GEGEREVEIGLADLRDRLDLAVAGVDREQPPGLGLGDGDVRRRLLRRRAHDRIDLAVAHREPARAEHAFGTERDREEARDERRRLASLPVNPGNLRGVADADGEGIARRGEAVAATVTGLGYRQAAVEEGDAARAVQAPAHQAYRT